MKTDKVSEYTGDPMQSDIVETIEDYLRETMKCSIILNMANTNSIMEQKELFELLLKAKSSVVYYDNGESRNCWSNTVDYADNTSLNDFDNPHSYNRFDAEALIIFAMGGFDEYEDYRKTREIYQEVQDIVYEDPNRLLSDTKKKLEQRVNNDKKKKMQYAVLYAAAIIEWYLRNH